MAPGQINFPNSLDTRDTLLRLGIDTETYLRQPLGTTDTRIVIDSTSRVSVPSGVLEVGNELVTYDSVDGNTLEIVEHGAFIGSGGYQAYPHPDGEVVRQRMLPIHHQVHSDAIIAIQEYLFTNALGPWGQADWDVEDLENGNSIFWNEAGNKWIAYTPYFGDEANTGALWSAANGQVPSWNNGTSEWVPITVSLPGHTHTASNITDFTEATQDVVGAFFADSTSLDVTYNDAGNALTAAVKYAGSGSAATAARSDHSHVGMGDVLGPAASTDGELPLFSGTTGKALKRSNTMNGVVKLAAGIASAGTLIPADMPDMGLVLIDTPTIITAQSSVTLQDYFTSEFTNYRIIVAGDWNGVNSTFYLRFANAGSPNTSANYYYGYNYASGTGSFTAGAGGASVATFIGISSSAAAGTSSAVQHVIDVASPAGAGRTTVTFQTWVNRSGQDLVIYNGGGMYWLSQAFDGFNLIRSGGSATFTGKLWVYGYGE